MREVHRSHGRQEVPRVPIINDVKSQAYVTGPRKDGKYAVQYVYPISGKRIHKLSTREQLDALLANAAYSVYGVQ